MRYLRLALLPLVFAACTERDAAAPDIDVTPNLSATVTNEVVYVHPARFTWMDNDPASEPFDVFLLGFDPADDAACNDGQLVGGIPAKRHLVVSQEGFPWGERDQIGIRTVGRPPLYLYFIADFPASPYPSEEWCTFLTEGWIAAGGWSAVFWSDNDISGFDGTPGVNSWGGTETGVLWGTDGSMYKYSWKYRVLTSPEMGTVVTHSIDRVEQIR